MPPPRFCHTIDVSNGVDRGQIETAISVIRAASGCGPNDVHVYISLYAYGAMSEFTRHGDPLCHATHDGRMRWNIPCGNMRLVWFTSQLVDWHDLPLQPDIAPDPAPATSPAIFMVDTTAGLGRDVVLFAKDRFLRLSGTDEDQVRVYVSRAAMREVASLGRDEMGGFPYHAPPEEFQLLHLLWRCVPRTDVAAIWFCAGPRDYHDLPTQPGYYDPGSLPSTPVAATPAAVAAPTSRARTRRIDLT